jgi:hypothetical protein
MAQAVVILSDQVIGSLIEDELKYACCDDASAVLRVLDYLPDSLE